MTQPGTPYVAYAPGADQPAGAAPAAILWLRIYCGFQLLFFLCVSGVGIFLIVAPLVDPASFPTHSGEPPVSVLGIILTALYSPMLVLYAVGLAAPRRRWLYIYGFVVCALSMVCGGCWPLSIPTLIYWLKPELKLYLGA
jgi:hypothetical protein